MDSDKPFEFLYQIFSRFLISGLVFYLFIIWLPCNIYLKLDTHKALNEPVFIILASIIIGLLLDISKFYNLLGKTIGSNREQLRRLIIESFNIQINTKNTSIEYQAKIIEVSRQIHDVFIRANCPDIDHRIKEIRIYPDILGITFLSVLFFLLLGGLFFLLYLILKLFNGLSFFPEYINFSFTYIRFILISFLNLSLIFVLIEARENEKKIYRLTNDLIGYMIREGCSKCDHTLRDRFLRSITDDLVIFNNDLNIWKIKED